MTFMKGYKQTPEQIRKRIEATAKAKIAWTDERRNLFKLRVSESMKGRVAWNKGKTGCMAIPWNKGTKGLMPTQWNKGNNWRDKFTLEELREIANIRARRRRSLNPQVRINDRMGAMVYQALKTRKNGHKWEDLVNYSLADLLEHLESQFRDGMSWGNIGQWHIDHIIPRSQFSFTSHNDIEFKECWALENLQPLWKEDNLRKYTRT